MIRSPRGTGRPLWALALSLAGCPGPATKLPDATPQTRAPELPEVAESIYDGSLKPGWQESGTAARELATGRAARVRFNDSGEWVLQRPGLAGRYGALLARVWEPPGEGEFLEVRVGSSDGRLGPRVKIKPDHRTDLGDGWAQLVVPMSELSSNDAPIDRVVFRTFRPLGEWALIDKVALAKAAPAGASASLAMASGERTRTRIDCSAAATKISPYIYGIAYGDKEWASLGATARRWGGNGNSRYNWEAHVNNRAQDWFFENKPSASYAEYLAETSAQNALTALTVPIIGWVAKDGTSYSFPVAKFGPQAKTDPWLPDAGNGMKPNGAKIAPGPPTQTSIGAPPEWIKRWIVAIVESDAKSGKRSIYEYILDNEPMLWSSTHRDVRPDPLGYDELLDRTIKYGSAIRSADPDALIAGPAEWGWSNYFYSAKDLSGLGIHSDRLAHGDVPLVEWYLRKLHESEQKTGVRVLDVLDLHYYPQASNVYGGGSGGVDRATQLLRLRSTRSLWDDAYVDESWIHETVRLLPRMKELVAKNYPGRGISLGEWNFGGEQDISGALATAEALGRFAQFGVTSAFYWTAPAAGSQSAFAFRAYRNFDGKGGRFLDLYVPTTRATDASFFASRDVEGKHIVVVALNLSPEKALLAQLDLSTCGSLASGQSFTYAGGSSGFAASSLAPDTATTVQGSLPPWSITVFDLHLQAAAH